MTVTESPETPTRVRGKASTHVEVLPDDAHNRALVEFVHPGGRQNPEPTGRYNLVVVGGGTAGLVSAAGAAGLGARVALVERHLMGGDCLNYGCVPSKAVLRVAHAAHAAREAEAFGIATGAVRADFGRAMERMRRLRTGIAHHDSVKRFTDLGVDVFLGDARFVGPDVLEVDARRLTFSRAIVATGARAAAPPIPGLEDAGYLTNETVFSLTDLPPRLAVIGAGPIGCEMAQAFARLGSAVTVVSRGPRILPREDADASAVVEAQLRREGISLRLGGRVIAVQATAGGRAVVFDGGAGEERIEVDEILVAVGRAPNVEGLGLEAAGVDADQTGVLVDDRLRTSNRRIYAAGDICSKYQFTHAADAMARVAIQNALFFGRRTASSLVIPWCTYTDPELAHVGIGSDEARAMGDRAVTILVPLADVDRAVLEGDDHGYAEAHIEASSGRILGVTIVARHAGDLIGPFVLAMTAGLRADQLSRTVLPYPTVGEVARKIGDQWARRRLTPMLRRVFERFLAWRR
ncbi:MAG: mercuric reductase [Vicinamibacterales bacterium]